MHRQSSSQSQSPYDSIIKSSKLPQLIRNNVRESEAFSCSANRETQWPGARSQYSYSALNKKRSSFPEHSFSPHISRLSSIKQKFSSDRHSEEKHQPNNHNGSFKQTLSPSELCHKSEQSCLSGSEYLNHDLNHLNEPVNVASFPSDHNISIEMMFLIREHSKTLAAVNKISKRLEELEQKVDNISKGISKVDPCSSTIKDGESNSGALILSDDSGGEYSRTTTGTATDDDELLSLLQQITKCSHQIKQTQEAQIYQNQVLSNSFTRAYSRPSNQLFSDSQNVLSKIESPTYSSSLSKQQSLSALLSEPSSEQFLNNIYQMMDNKNSLLSSHGSNLNQASVLQSLSTCRIDRTLKNQIDRAQNLIEKRRQDGLESQYKKAEEWLVNQLLLRAHNHVNCDDSKNESRGRHH